MTMEIRYSSYWDRDKLFQLFKYTIYGLILIDVIYFMIEDFAASEHTFRGGIDLSNIGNAFSAFLDSIAWFILLMIFELETYALEDDQLSDRRKLALNIGAAICYFFILLAFWGYCEKSLMIYAFAPSPITDLCAVISHDLSQNLPQTYSLALYLDDYVPLTLENCRSVVGQVYFQSDTLIYADPAVMEKLKKLVLIDIVNGFTWLVIIVVLQIEVYLQLRGHLSSVLYRLNSIIKVIAYGLILLACIYWGYLGDLMGFWDALLWLSAFIFIELNIFQWRQEEEEEEEPEKVR